MKPYFRGIEMYNEALMVKVVYPPRWKAYPSADERIKVTQGENDKSLTYYYADSKDTTYERSKGITLPEYSGKGYTYNGWSIKGTQEKILKTKVEELKELFSKLSYDELKTIKFVTEGVKTTKGRKKYTKKAKEAEKAQEQPQIENNEEKMEEEEIKND